MQFATFRMSKQLPVVFWVVLAGLYGCAIKRAELRPVTPPGVKTVSMREWLALKTKDTTVKLIDVRSEGEYRQGHIPGAVNIPRAQLAQRTSTFPRNQRLIVTCGCCPFSACPNAVPATQELQGLGFTRVTALYLPNGLDSWTAAGHPLEGAIGTPWEEPGGSPGLSPTQPSAVLPAPTATKPLITLQAVFQPLDTSAGQVITLLTALRDTFGGALAIQFTYGVREDAASREVISPYGSADVEEAARQRLLAQRAPEALWRYLAALYKTPGQPQWRSALQEAGISAELSNELTQPLASPQVAGTLLRQDLTWLQNHPAIEESPALLIQDQVYQGPWRPDSLKAVINEAMRAVEATQARPDIPACYTDFDFWRPNFQGRCMNPGTSQARFEWQPAPRVRAIVITDRTSPFLNLRPTLSQLKRQFPGLTETIWDYRAPPAQPWRPLVAGSLPLPLFLFDQGVEAVPTFKESQSRGWFVPIAQSTAPASPRLYFLHPALQGEMMAFPYRPQYAKTLEIFIMSQCPFGVQASLSLLDAKKRRLIPPDVTLRWRYIADRATTTASGFTALHGPEEVAENIRQLIIQTHFPAQFPTYLDKRFRELAQAPWQQAALASGLDPAKIEPLVHTEGARLLGGEVQLTHSLNIHASPTFLWENQLVVRHLRQLTKVPPFQRIEIGQTAGSCRK